VRALGPATLLSVVALSGCGKSGEAKAGSDAKKGPQAEQQALGTSVPVAIVRVEHGDIVASMTFSATVESERNIVVYPQTTGLVERVLAEEGDRVERGQALVQLDDDDARIALERAQVELRKLQSDSLRTAGLYAKGLESRDAYETALYQVSRARLALEEAGLGLQRTRIRAPVGGIISQRSTEIGNRVSPSSEVYRLVTLDSLIAQVHVPGRTRPHIRLDQQARITSDMLPDYEIGGTIERINPVVDPESGTVKVTVALADSGRRFTPGMFANVALITDRRANVLLLPKETLAYDAGQPYVFVLRDSVARRTRLEVGLSNPRVVEVTAGVAPGDSVVIVGQEGLRDGATVRVVEEPFRPVTKEQPTAKDTTET